MTNKVLPWGLSDQLRNKFKMVKRAQILRAELPAFEASHDGDMIRVLLYPGSVSSLVRVNVHRTNGKDSIEVVERECRFIKQAKEFITYEMNKRVDALRGGRKWK